MPSAKPAPFKRAGFYCELPVSTIATIKRRTTATKPQWMVIHEAVEGVRRAKSVPAKKTAKKRRK